MRILFVEQPIAQTVMAAWVVNEAHRYGIYLTFIKILVNYIYILARMYVAIVDVCLLQ